MIKTIIFDFGNVFINIDIEGATKNTLKTFKINKLPKSIIETNAAYEKGLLSSDAFVEFYCNYFSNTNSEKVIDSWNFILRDFPKHRLDFLKELKANKKYKLILLSNTNELHINFIKEKFHFYEEFKSCFDAFYLSHEIQLAKPDQSIYNYVLHENNLKANECLFIDDNKDNIISAKQLGIHTWLIDPVNEDVSQLYKNFPIS